MTSETIPHQREAAFHDAWASSTKLEDVLVRECFEAPTALENQFILSRMGTVRDKRLLDIGAGLGESSVYFALQGAQVTPLVGLECCDVGREELRTVRSFNSCAQLGGRRPAQSTGAGVTRGEV